MASTAYEILGYDTAFFLRLDASQKTPFPGLFFTIDGKKSSRWFVVSFSNDNAAVFVRHPRTFPFLHFNSTNHYGIDILSGKLDGETWFLSHDGGSVVFSNDVFSVAVSRRDSESNTKHEIKTQDFRHMGIADAISKHHPKPQGHP